MTKAELEEQNALEAMENEKRKEDTEKAWNDYAEEMHKLHSKQGNVK